MERCLIIFIILFIIVGLFITKTSKLKYEKFRDDERELKFLNRNIDSFNSSLQQINGFNSSLLNLIK